MKSVSSIQDDYLEAATGVVLRNFVKFTEKHLCWSLFLIKLQACKFIEKRLQHWCFPLHVRKFLRTPILKNTEWLVLIILLVLNFLFVFGCLFTNNKEKLIFWWRKCSLKFDYGIEWRMFLKTISKLFRYTWCNLMYISILNRLKTFFHKYKVYT